MQGLFERVKADFDWIKFRVGHKFAFRAPRTVFFEDCRGESDMLKNSVQVNNEVMLKKSVQNDPNLAEQIFYLLLFHEIGHAVLGHKDFLTDVERLKMERAAWEEARKFCKKYKVFYDEDRVESEMDTYRDWLHGRSVCKICGLTRFQTLDGQYHCPRCNEILGIMGKK